GPALLQDRAGRVLPQPEQGGCLVYGEETGPRIRLQPELPVAGPAGAAAGFRAEGGVYQDLQQTRRSESRLSPLPLEARRAPHERPGRVRGRTREAAESGPRLRQPLGLGEEHAVPAMASV